MKAESVAVVGGGASGLVAAIVAARNGALVTVYESCDRIGKKILATGNGRCNLTNLEASKEHYHGGNPDFIEGVQGQFWTEETLDFFGDLGLLYKSENGKVYPYSDSATSVLDILRAEMERLNIRVVTNTEIKDIEESKNGYILKSFDENIYFANKIIVATGGKAAPALGSKGSGYNILQNFGHTLTELRPSLVQLCTGGDVPKKLKGIKVQARLCINSFSQFGEILFTDYGISGPPVFYLSAYANEGDVATIDLMSEYSDEEILNMIYTRICKNPDMEIGRLFVGVFQKRIGEVFLKSIDVAPLSRSCDSLTENEINKICNSLKRWTFRISSTMSWNNAQVTRGGINTAEVDAKTLESKKQKNIYVCGEILDIDGDCGGYNLQWAWASGYVAGNSATILEG